jgi:hypothetical protein
MSPITAWRLRELHRWTIDVYDAAKKVDGIKVVADIMRIQAEQGQLQVIREFGVQNTSTPPRTQMNEHNLEFYIPDGAQVIRFCDCHHRRMAIP